MGKDKKSDSPLEPRYGHETEVTTAYWLFISSLQTETC